MGEQDDHHDDQRRRARAAAEKVHRLRTQHDKLKKQLATLGDQQRRIAAKLLTNIEQLLDAEGEVSAASLAIGAAPFSWA